MADSVLLLATGYDSSTYYTRSWAKDLREQLLRRKHNCLMLDAESLCYAGHTLHEAIERVDFVVFYGHGLFDQWIAMPSGCRNPALPLVHVNNVQVFQGRKVYSGCCESLKTLGNSYIATFPNGSFVGYNAQFEFEFSNHREFGDVVNASVINYVSGDSAKMVAQNLATEWDNLRHDFANGRLKNKPNAIMAAQRADNNRQRVRALP
jgi:hypothetical protein